MTANNSRDPNAILDGIRRWVEIETPTEAPEQVNRLATLVADGYRELAPASPRIGSIKADEDFLISHHCSPA